MEYNALDSTLQRKPFPPGELTVVVWSSVVIARDLPPGGWQLQLTPKLLYSVLGRKAFQVIANKYWAVPHVSSLEERALNSNPSSSSMLIGWTLSLLT